MELIVLTAIVLSCCTVTIANYGHAGDWSYLPRPYRNGFSGGNDINGMANLLSEADYNFPRTYRRHSIDFRMDYRKAKERELAKEKKMVEEQTKQKLDLDLPDDVCPSGNEPLIVNDVAVVCNGFTPNCPPETYCYVTGLASLDYFCCKSY